MDSDLGKLSITREDQDELVWDESDDIDSTLNDYCLVGKFLTDKTLDFTAMCNRLINLWRPGKGIHIKDIPSKNTCLNSFILWTCDKFWMEVLGLSIIFIWFCTITNLETYQLQFH